MVKFMMVAIIIIIKRIKEEDHHFLSYLEEEGLVGVIATMVCCY